MYKKKSVIMIVDDERVNINLLTEILSDKFQIKVAINGEQALKRTQTEPKPDLILLDIKMPGMDGYQVCEQLKANPVTSKIPVIFISMLSSVDDEKKGLEMGAVDYITKPFNPSIVTARIETHLRLKYYNEELSKKNSELNRLNESKNKFFKIISHDLRGPIGAMHTLTEIILAEHNVLDPDKLNDFLQMLTETSKNTFGLLENLLEWSKAESGQLNNELSNINLSVEINEVLKLMTTMFKEKQVKVSTLISDEIRIKSDKNIIKTVLRNLLSNALKFTSQEKEVKISLFKNDKFAVIEVKDQGIGMNKDKLDSLFQIDKVKSEKGTNQEKGSGLGLVLCHQLLQKISGEIEVSSKLNQGSTLRIKLPLLLDNVQ